MNKGEFKGDWSFVVQKKFCCNDLSIGAKMLYILLKSYCAPNGNTAFPSTRLLSHQLKISEKTLLKHARELESGKWLSRKQIDGETGRFTHTLWTIYGSNSWEPDRTEHSTARKEVRTNLNQ